MGDRRRKRPATRRQLERLHFYKVEHRPNISAGEADDLIEGFDDPQVEAEYKAWILRKDKAEAEMVSRTERFLHDRDGLELEGLRAPARSMVRQALESLDRRSDDWETRDRSLLFQELRRLNPELRIRRPAKRRTRWARWSRTRLGLVVSVIVALIVISILVAFLERA